MSDKPLDAIGFDSARGVGKHDFVKSPHLAANPTNTVSGTVPVLSLDDLTKAVAVLKKQIDPMDIDHADCGTEYWDALTKRIPTALSLQSINTLLWIPGFHIHVSSDVPPDVIEFKNKEGLVVYADCL